MAEVEAGREDDGAAELVDLGGDARDGRVDARGLARDAVGDLRGLPLEGLWGDAADEARELGAAALVVVVAALEVGGGELEDEVLVLGGDEVDVGDVEGRRDEGLEGRVAAGHLGEVVVGEPRPALGRAAVAVRGAVLGRRDELALGAPDEEEAVGRVPRLAAAVAAQGGADEVGDDADVGEDDVGLDVVVVEREPGRETGEKLPTLPGSYLDRFRLDLAHVWTSDHLSGRIQSVDAFLSGVASLGANPKCGCLSLGSCFENTHVEATLNHPFPALA